MELQIETRYRERNAAELMGALLKIFCKIHSSVFETTLVEKRDATGIYSKVYSASAHLKYLHLLLLVNFDHCLFTQTSIKV